jgi:hypothetical protein
VPHTAIPGKFMGLSHDLAPEKGKASPSLARLDAGVRQASRQTE